MHNGRPEKFGYRKGGLSSYEALCKGLVVEAVESLTGCARLDGYKSFRAKQLRRLDCATDALEWFLSADDSLFSFERCCQVVGYCPRIFREGIYDRYLSRWIVVEYVLPQHNSYIRPREE